MKSVWEVPKIPWTLWETPVSTSSYIFVAVAIAIAGPFQITGLWSELTTYDSNFKLGHKEKLSIKSLTPRLSDFSPHCCRERHYFFEVVFSPARSASLHDSQNLHSRSLYTCLILCQHLMATTNLFPMLLERKHQNSIDLLSTSSVRKKNVYHFPQVCSMCSMCSM